MCHLIPLLPIAGLAVFWIFPMSIAAPLYSGVLVVSAVVGWKVLLAARRPIGTGAEAMVGRQAVAITPLVPLGKVTCGPEIWRARAEEGLPEGARVRVVRLEGLVLVVRRDERSAR
ncbi:MAG: NfeD family protein [Deltaproteobacteria bacterium]|nr:NfeD family protein [Deltaproteobacteria bacterium]